MIDVSARGGREPRHVPEREGNAWKRMVTVVPRPGALVRPMVPPQLSTSRRAMASPRPEPLEVVENAGSKTRGRIPGAIPRPSSSTASPHPPSERRTVTRRAPALRAFSSRLMRTSFTSSRRADASAPGSPASATVASASAPPSVYRFTTSRATAWTSTGSSGSASAAGDAKRENARAIASSRSISARIRPAVSASVASKSRLSFFSRARCRCWMPRRIGVRGFLISCATWRAISPQASTRAARVRAVASSSATTQPSGAGPRGASCTRIWRPPTANSRSTIPSVVPSRYSRTAFQTTSHSAGAARGSKSPGVRGAPKSSAARGLANVATGVIALDDGLRVTMANPRAAELLGAPLTPGDLLPRAAPAEWLVVWSAVREFLDGTTEGIVEREFAVGGRQIRVQLASLGPAPDGCVVALDDATALTRAARVLAWGEMARQVAHEIKNPLTPIRLGIQHLQRAREKRVERDFDATLAETAGRILAEIDRLDAIARAFSRFASPAAEALPLEPVEVHAVAREVVHLYTLGGAEAEATVALAGESGALASARRDEVKEVLINLLENARNAGARHVTVRLADGGCQLVVEDDGRGIPPDVLPRVFDPAFSTTSSGSGLGLAIARRLVESWGGTIGLTSAPGRGTTVTMRFQGSPSRSST